MTKTMKHVAKLSNGRWVTVQTARDSGLTHAQFSAALLQLDALAGAIVQMRHNQDRFVTAFCVVVDDGTKSVFDFARERIQMGIVYALESIPLRKTA